MVLLVLVLVLMLVKVKVIMIVLMLTPIKFWCWYFRRHEPSQVRDAELRKDVVEEKLQVKKEVKVEEVEKEESEGELEDEDLEGFLDWRIKKLS